MKATDIDGEVPCPVCGGDGKDPIGEWNGEKYIEDDCRFCGGCCSASRHGPKHDDLTPSDHSHYVDDSVHLHTNINENNGALVVCSIPRQDDRRGGFEGMFDDYQPANIPSDIQHDLDDQLNNRHIGENATNGEYPNGVKASDFPDGTFPAEPKLSIDQAIAWMESRGDTVTATYLRTIKQEQGL